MNINQELEDRFGDTHNCIAEYLNEISYDEIMVLFLLLDRKIIEYEDGESSDKPTPNEVKAIDLIVPILCHRFNKCIDFEKEDPYEDFRPML